MTEQELVKKCLTDICRKIGFEDPALLTQRNYELISREIEDKTGTLISVSTIKRLLHGEFSRIPQTATLNAISAYLGFKNWQEYRTSLRPLENEMSAVPEPPVLLPKDATRRFTINRKLFWPIAIVLLIVAVLGVISFSSGSAPHFDKARFSARKTTENDMPNTVIFNYDIDAVNADSFFIQQSWDKNRRVRIYKGSHTLTDIYYLPGYHTAKLIANDSIIKTIDVSIPTNRWFFLATDKEPKSIPQYINPRNPVKNGSLGLDITDLDSNHVSTAEEKVYYYSYFPQKIETNSDNYVLKTRARMIPVKNNYCPYLMFEVFCQRNFMYFISHSQGCASESSTQFGETVISGKQTDLSALCADVSQWMDVEILVKNRQAKIFINNKEVLTTNYTHPSGLITGLGFISNGLCEIDEVTLKGLDGKIIYQNDFNK